MEQQVSKETIAVARNTFEPVTKSKLSDPELFEISFNLLGFARTLLEMEKDKHETDIPS